MINLVTEKLKLAAAYCENGMKDRAIMSMGDVNAPLLETVTLLMEYSAKRPNCGIDKQALVGSLQLVMDSMSTGNMTMLAAAILEGLLPELERGAKILKPAGVELVLSSVSTADRVSADDCVDLAEQTSAPERIIAPGRIPADFSEGIAKTICLFGYGDGQFYEELCKAAPQGSNFIVYEPERDTIPELRTALQENIDFYKLDGVVVLASPGYDTVFKTEYIDFIHAINENRERILVNKNTLKRFKDNASRNVITNLHILEKCNLVSDISSILPRYIPVIIVSAGPSLDKNIELLKEAKGHCLIFAVDTAMKYLMQHNIMPDLGITVEPIKPMANYADDRCFDVPHIFDCESNPEIVSKERGRIFIYNCRDYVKRLLEDAGVEVPADVASGGSVATAAFAICYQLQIKNIILIGQDLAYEGTSTHAGGVESAGINGDIGYEMVDGIYGEPVRTRSDWTGYLRWFENAITMINSQKLDMKVIDATEGGALIHGSYVMTLRDVIDKYCGEVEYVFEDELKRLPYMLDEEDYAAVRKDIETSFAELSDVKRKAKEASILCGDIIASGKAKPESVSRISALRAECESALLYSLINNYAVSDIIDEVNRLQADKSVSFGDIRQKKLAFDAIAKACDYFAELANTQ